MTQSDGFDRETAQGPELPCPNGDCEHQKPKTTVHESERKTIYRCPGCRQGLDVEWHENP